MPNTSVENDIRRAAELRKLAKTATTTGLKSSLNAAANRVEAAAARKARRLGKRTGGGSANFVR